MNFDLTDFDQLLISRRSIRAYEDEVPGDEIIQVLLGGVLGAPSPSNLQPVRFVRIKSTALRAKLRFEMNEGHRVFLEMINSGNMNQKVKNWVNSYYRYSEFMFGAPVMFAVGTVENDKSFAKVLHRAGLIERDTRGETDMDISVGLSLSAFMLKAVEMGLATCILTAPLNYINDVEKILGLDSVKIKCFITLGYAAESPDEVVHKSVSEIYREL